MASNELAVAFGGRLWPKIVKIAGNLMKLRMFEKRASADRENVRQMSTCCQNA